jgi:hypothetical protein
MADEDVARERWQEQRGRALGALQAFLDERGIVDRELRVHVFAIHNWLGRFDNREAQRFALDQMEQGFWTEKAWDRSGRRAVALWRLHQQLHEAEDLMPMDRDHCD